MSDEPELKCPVCRARQKRQAECRRCGADLSLYVKALGSAELAQHQRQQARLSGDDERAASIDRYLHWLKPGMPTE